ncbi:MAG: rRNA maturation RNase YbeY [Candidatus Omnitrophica bacterium]|nr:rRNA maturation RNase YbeY [Candidatus Omnitrophota bacterium]
MINPVRNLKETTNRHGVSNRVNIAVINLQEKALVYPKAIKKLVKRVLKEERIKAGAEITVSIVNDRIIRKLNMLYLKKDLPTDVLAFNSTETFDKNNLYADIIVSSDTAAYNAKVFNTTFNFELKLYVIHGLLHLLGYNHSSAKKRKTMLRKELKYVHT